MNKKSLFELLYCKNFKKTLKYMRKYQAYMSNGIDYEQLHELMKYDYKLFLTQSNNNVITNITSKEDAECKFKALSLAKENLEIK